MPIKFPRVHVARSVVNQILDVHDELERGRAIAASSSPTPAPTVPDPTLEGAELETRLRQPPGEVPPTEPPAPGPDELASGIARGADLIDAQ